MNKIILYHLPNSRSQRIVWLFEELKIPYYVVLPTCQEFKSLPPHLSNIKFPTICVNHTDGDLYLSESTAVCDYILANIPNTLNVSNFDLKNFETFIFWKNFADGTFTPNVCLKQIFMQIHKRTPLPFKPISYLFKFGFDKAYLDTEIDNTLKRINNQLTKTQWLGGEEFSVADILMWFPIEACIAMRSKVTPLHYQFPHLMSYYNRIQSRAAFQKALKIGIWNPEKFSAYWNV
jgi:glutathione S-transferase